MRTNIEIDDELLARAMRTYGLRTKREAVDYALRRLVAEPLNVDEARALRGSGWDADLDDVREGSRVDSL
jgi:Arc/MetJ family transcription regulator